MKLEALPHLEGRRGTIVRAVYLVFAAITLVVMAGSLVFTGIDLFRNVPNTLALGFRTYTEQGRPVVRDVAPEAARAGVREGDTIVAIDGTALPDSASEFDIGARLGRVGETVALTTRGTDGRVGTHRLKRGDGWTRTDTASNLPAWLYASIEFLSAHLSSGFLVAASLLLFLRRGRDSEAMLFAFAFLLIGIRSPGFWLRAIGGVPSPLFDFGTSTGWALALIAVAGFPDGRFTSRVAKLLALATSVTWVLSEGTRVSGYEPPAWFWTLTFGLTVILATAAIVLRYRATPAGLQRQQIKWAVTGFCVSMLGMAISIGMYQAGIYGYSGSTVLFLLWVTTTALTIGMPLGLLVSLLRYRLYDADTAISRSVAYGMLTLTLLAIFAGSEKLIEALGEQYFGGSLGALAGGLGAAIAAVMIVPLHHRLTHWAERRFQGNVARMRRGLPLLVGDMRETASRGDMAETVLKRVEQGTRAVRGALIAGDRLMASRHVDAETVERWRAAWVPSEREGLDCAQSDPLFPMRVPLDADGCGRVGWVLLGPRPDGSFFGKDEREALEEIADPVARAIAVVSEREARQAALDGRIGKLEAAVARLMRNKTSATA